MQAAIGTMSRSRLVEQVCNLLKASAQGIFRSGSVLDQNG